MKGRMHMDFVIDNWMIIVAAIAFATMSVITAIRFFNKNTDEQREKVQEWLLYATTLAEKEFGGGTGKIKLRYVYDMFVDKFPWLAKIVSFDRFSCMVDESLVKMNELLSNNYAVQLYVDSTN